MLTRPLFLRALSCALLALAPLTALAQDGPTPYPDKEDEAAWPGSGPIRTFGWMVDNRAAFWKAREKDQGAVVFVGDSLTGGWKTLAKDMAPLKVANRGIGGDTSRGVLFRFKEDVLDLNPRAIVICVGSNDLSAHGAPSAVESNLSEMISMARAQNAELPIVIGTLPPRNDPKAPIKPGALEEVNTRIAGLGQGDKNIVICDLFTPLATPEGEPHPEYFGAGLVHIRPGGYVKWAEAVKAALEKAGVTAQSE